MKTTLTIVLAALIAAGCGGNKPKPATTPQAKQDKPVATADKKLMEQVTQDQKVSPGLALSGDLIQMCGIKPTASTTANPKFDYDKDELTTDDRNVLDQLAQCMMSGALKG